MTHALGLLQRMWEFAIGLILLELRPGSLALVSAFGLVDSIAQVIAGPHIGCYIDRSATLIAPTAASTKDLRQPLSSVALPHLQPYLLHTFCL